MIDKIAFIMCSNNRQYLEQCLRYIDALTVPEGMEKENVVIEGAASMTSGYNEAMKRTDAKYKVYLHQDVFIVNRNFIADLLNIFREDNSIGMVGMVGTPELPDSLVPWEAERVGCIYYNNIVSTGCRCFSANEGLYSEVACIDGLLMATQVDVPWREDIFKKWDFYDVSQSFEMRRKGYKVVVPNIRTPWVYHDDGIPNLSNYDGQKAIFRKEYFGC